MKILQDFPWCPALSISGDHPPVGATDATKWSEAAYLIHKGRQNVFLLTSSPKGVGDEGGKITPCCPKACRGGSGKHFLMTIIAIIPGAINCYQVAQLLCAPPSLMAKITKSKGEEKPPSICRGVSRRAAIGPTADSQTKPRYIG